MHPHEDSRNTATPPSPIHVVNTGQQVRARSEALRPFHQALDEADRNLRALLPPKRPVVPFPAPVPAPAPDPAPEATFELRAPWYMDSADQPA